LTYGIYLGVEERRQKLDECIKQRRIKGTRDLEYLQKTLKEKN
jgi:hypothetical protein